MTAGLFGGVNALKLSRSRLQSALQPCGPLIPNISHEITESRRSLRQRWSGRTLRHLKSSWLSWRPLLMISQSLRDMQPAQSRISGCFKLSAEPEVDGALD